MELLWLSVHRGNFRLTLHGNLLSSPNAPVDILDQLQSSLQNIECSCFNNLVLLSDFNVDFGSSTGSLFTKLENTMSTFMLKQMAGPKISVFLTLPIVTQAAYSSPPKAPVGNTGNIKFFTFTMAYGNAFVTFQRFQV